MNRTFKSMKIELKELAKELRTAKLNLKECQRTDPGVAYKPQGIKDQKQSDYRHRHITYCLLRGTPYERIENPREGNEPDWNIIDKLKEAFFDEKENVLACAV
jgi:hypothetical protein